MSALTYYHSGDLGDIIFSLPLIRWQGGGILVLDSSGGRHDPLVSWAAGLITATKLDHASCVSLQELLRTQDYIEDVRIVDGPCACDVNLNLFREHVEFNNLAFSHLAILEHDPRRYPDLARAPWIRVEPMPLPAGRDIVIARNLRYQSNHSYWECLPRDISARALFVGRPLEYDVFTKVYPYHAVEYVETTSILHLARLIAGAKRFLGNQGLPHALAEAMGVPLTCEVDASYPAAVFPDKPSSIYI
jgi:hypothetical protein